jgi:lysozyme C
MFKKLFLLALIVSLANAKIWDFCELAELLRCRHGFSMEELPHWMCLIENESSYNQGAMNKQNSDGSWDWGLFQINDQ